MDRIRFRFHGMRPAEFQVWCFDGRGPFNWADATLVGSHRSGNRRRLQQLALDHDRFCCWFHDEPEYPERPHPRNRYRIKIVWYRAA